MTSTGHRYTAHLEDDTEIVASSNCADDLVAPCLLHAEALTRLPAIYTDVATGRIAVELFDDGGVETVTYFVDEDPDWEPE